MKAANNVGRAAAAPHARRKGLVYAYFQVLFGREMRRRSGPIADIGNRLLRRFGTFLA